MAEQPLISPFQEITTINSSYYDKYQLRPYNPAELYQKFEYRIYDEMRTDDQLSALLKLQKNTIINSGYVVVGDSPEVNDFVKWCLDEVNFEQALFEMMSAMDYGFSLTEKTFTPKETEWGSLICLKSLKTRAPHTFEFKQDDAGDVETVKQYGAIRGSGDVIVPYDKFIHIVNDAEFDNPYGNSMMNRGVYTAWWSKKAIIKFWNIYLERFGNPLAIAKYDAAKTTATQQSDLENVLKNLQAKTGIKIPQSVELTFLEATKGGEGFERAIDKYNMLMARAFLTPDLMGLGGAETGGGSYALGDIHQKSFLQNLERPRRQLQRSINIQLIAPLVDMNFGPIECSLAFKPMSEDVALEKIKLWLDVVQKAGIPINPEDEKWIRESVGAPPPFVPEIMPPVDPAAVPADPLDLLDPATPQAEPMADLVQNSAEPAQASEPLEDLATYALEKLEYDAKVNYTKIEKNLDDSQARLVESLGLVIKDSVNGLVSDIKKKNIIGKSSLWAVNNLQLKGWDKFRTVMKRGLKDVRDSGWDDGSSEAGSKKKNMIEGGQGPNINVDDYIDDVAMNSSQAAKDEILTKVKAIVREGIRSGKSQSQIMAEIDIALKNWDITTKRDAGMAEVGPNRLETIVRTNLSNAYNEGRLEYFESEPELIQGYQFSAIMDGRTSDRCQSLHGKVFRPSEARSYNPPMHYNCRSLLVPITVLDQTPKFTKDIPAKADTDFK